MSMQAGSIDADGLARTSDGKLYVTLAGSAAGFADGTVSVPSIAWSSDADGTGTGLYRGAANQIWIAQNGVYGGRFAGGNWVIPNANALAFESSGTAGSSGDVGFGRGAANSLVFGGTTYTGGAATTRTELNKSVTAIADAVATAALTITIPNAAHSASLRVRVTGSLGAGGAIGANEATAANEYIITFARTAGVAAVAAISAAYGAAAAAVAGAATVTCTAAMSAVSGAVGATNTFTVNVTITRSGGSSTNHTCLVYAQLMNANATGITIA